MIKKHLAKRMKTGLYIVTGLLLFFQMSCEDRDWNNPLDPAAVLDSNAWRTSNIDIEIINDRSIRMVWSNREQRVEGYEIFRSDGDDSLHFYTAIGNTREYVDEAVTSGMIHLYQVRAFAGENRGQFSDTVGCITEYPPPDPLFATPVSESEVHLTWSATQEYLTDYDAQGFIIDRKVSGGEYILVDSLEVNMRSYTDRDLIQGTQYYYRLRAFNEVNASSPYVRACFTKEVLSPSNVEARLASESSIQLFWEVNSEFAAGQKVFRHHGGSVVMVGELPITTSEFTDSDLIYGEIYAYTVNAFTSAHEGSPSPLSAEIEVRIARPTQLELFAVSDQSISLAWEDNCSFESAYRVYRSSTSSQEELLVELGADVTTFLDEGLNFRFEYHYRIVAVAGVYESDPLEASGTPIQPTPTDLRVQKNEEGLVELTWTDHSVLGQVYTVYRDTGSGFVSLATLPANTVYYLDNSLDPDLEGAFYKIALTTIDGSVFFSEVYEYVAFVEDVDGNRYDVVKIGDDHWMRENLRTAHYQNGDAIPQVSDPMDWNDLATPARCSYDNDTTNAETMGFLYNLAAAFDERNPAPEGWHIPSAIEFENLREEGSTYLKPEVVPIFGVGCSGLRHYSGANFTGVGDYSVFWCYAENVVANYKIYCTTGYANIRHVGTTPYDYGLSLRCVRDPQ